MQNRYIKIYYIWEQVISGNTKSFVDVDFGVSPFWFKNIRRFGGSPAIFLKELKNSSS